MPEIDGGTYVILALIVVLIMAVVLSRRV